MDVSSIIGLGLGLLAVLGGAVLEGLHLGSITQGTAAIIVMGGTLGATLLSFPMKTIMAAVRAVGKIMTEKNARYPELIREIINYAVISRREGLIALEKHLPEVSDDFLRRALSLTIDGTDTKVLRETMEIEMGLMETKADLEAKVYEAAGGYSPTIGIIGAVLGLIHVMQNLSDPGKLGSGIAVAFVATVYGVASANLVFFPFASKLRVKGKEAMVSKEIILEGVLGMLEGVNPRVIEERLKGYLSPAERAEVEEKKGEAKLAEKAAA